MNKLSHLLCLTALLIVGYFTYVKDYENPPHFFWDENYHVAHAQKYLNGVFFMEPHPPLGKLLIALGEWVLNENNVDDSFIGTDHASKLPEGYSFAGYRLFPTVFAWLTIALVFCVFLELLPRQPWTAGLLTLPYVFDNALVVHQRGAMLEPFLVFFFALAVLAALRLARGTGRIALWSVVYGVSLGGLATTKLTGLIALGFIPLIVFVNRKSLVRAAVPAFLSFVMVYIAVWGIHFSLGRRIVPELSNKGFYGASTRYQELIKSGDFSVLRHFPLMLQEHLAFVATYQRGVPSLNLCKTEENGSPAYFWPVGARTINYRWEKHEGKTQYLYLVSNPAGWALSLAGVILCAAFLLSSGLNSGATLASPMILVTMTILWIGYMGAMLLLSRVMYLYHYFVPLLMGWWLLGLAVNNIVRIGPFLVGQRVKNGVITLSAAATIACFSLFAPLTYYRPLTNDQFNRLAWLPIWDLKCAGCQSASALARPLGDPKERRFPDLTISGLRAEQSNQQWGEPKQNRAVEGELIIVNGVRYEQGLGVHAQSTLTFKLNKRYRTFKGLAGLPDYVKEKGGSVIFQIRGDGAVVWTSEVIRPGMAPAAFEIPVSDYSLLQLEVSDAGDGNSYDHGCWLSPELLP